MTKFESLQRAISEGKMERREFIKKAMALGMAGAIPGLLLSEEALASGPKLGGTFRQGLSEGSTSDTLFGVLGSGGSHQVNIQWQLLNNLTEINSKGQVVGELAESWEASADATEWTFKLRKGVEFHNGKSFEAKDVVHSINVHRGADTVSTGKGLVASVQDVRADGKHTVIFKLDSGNADFPYTLTDYHFPIAPDGSTPADWEKGIGTGPYILEEWEPGVQAITKRNPNYFKGGPNFDRVVTLNIPDVAARMNAIRTGEVDVIDKPDIQTLHLMERVPGIVVSERSGNTHYTFPMIMDKGPFDNHNVRQAMKFAIDREAMLDTILNGHGYVGNDHPISRSQRYFAKDLPQRSYDPDKAKHYLKKAGLSKLDVTLSAADIFTGGVDAATLFKEHAAKGNININVDRVSADGYWSNVWNTVPFCVSYWAGRPTEDLMLSLAFSAKSAWNETHWNNEQFEKLLVSARAELDETKRQEMYSEMQRLISDEGGLIAPVFANTIDIISDKVGTPATIASNYAVDGYRSSERWWFK